MIMIRPSLLTIGAITLISTWTVAQESASFTGILSIGCTEGSCTFSADCDPDETLGVIPGNPKDDGGTDNSYTEINGEVRLTPAACQAQCTQGCIAIPGSDQDGNHECIGSAGYVWCQELKECIRPWSSNCPFEGKRMVGPATINCDAGGRCNDLSETCSIEVGSAVIGGPYLSGLAGKYELPEGCTATCQGCVCEDCKENSAAPTFQGPHRSLPLTILCLAFSALLFGS